MGRGGKGETEGVERRWSTRHCASSFFGRRRHNECRRRKKTDPLSLSLTPFQAYEELGKIGEGTYGTVLRCRHRGTGEMVAVKRFKESGEENQVRMKRERERASRGRLSQENEDTSLGPSSTALESSSSPFSLPRSRRDHRKLSWEWKKARKTARETRGGAKEHNRSRKGHFSISFRVRPWRRRP